MEQHTKSPHREGLHTHMSNELPPGQVAWVDLTIEDAEGIRDFYQKVVGWESAEVDLGEYSDFTMMAGDQAVAGICHARGVNADVPPQWLIYLMVADLEKCLLTCEANGGKVLVAPRQAGSGRCAVIEDPAGACVALYQN